MNFKDISKIYNLDEGRIIGVDQTSSNADMTCLCFDKYKDGKLIIKDTKYIEKQEDMDKYINRNLAKFDKYFNG